MPAQSRSPAPQPDHPTYNYIRNPEHKRISLRLESQDLTLKLKSYFKKFIGNLCKFLQKKLLRNNICQTYRNKIINSIISVYFIMICSVNILHCFHQIIIKIMIVMESIQAESNRRDSISIPFHSIFLSLIRLRQRPYLAVFL